MSAPPSRRIAAGNAPRVERILAWTGTGLSPSSSPSQLSEVSANVALQQRLPRADDHLALRRIEPHHIERLAIGDAEAAALADGEMDDAVMAAETAAIDMHDIARLRRIGPEPQDHVGIAAFRHEADVLAVGLLRHRQSERGGDLRVSRSW